MHREHGECGLWPDAGNVDETDEKVKLLLFFEPIEGELVFSDVCMNKKRNFRPFGVSQKSWKGSEHSVPYAAHEDDHVFFSYSTYGA
jgi:hypothetical protein